MVLQIKNFAFNFFAFEKVEYNVNPKFYMKCYIYLNFSAISKENLQSRHMLILNFVWENEYKYIHTYPNIHLLLLQILTSC